MLKLLLLAAALQAAPERLPKKFLERHCVDCHDAETRKGGVDLSALGETPASRTDVDLWVRVHDRTAAGEMPPAKKPRPPQADLMAFLGDLGPALAAADRKRREVVHRRLNRFELEHALHDLLDVDVPLRRLLPEDGVFGGFDTHGEALSVSAEHLAGLLEAAETAIDAALAAGPRPATETFTVDSLKECAPYLPQKLYSLVDGRIVVYMSDESRYSKISTRERRLPVRGRYRFRLEVASVNSPKPLTFSVSASDFAPVSASFKPLGYFEAGLKPHEVEFEAVLDARDAVQFFASGLPAWVNQPAAGSHPGIAFGPVTVTGPIIDRWPPAGRTRLLGDVDPARGTLEDAGRILESFMPRAWRRTPSPAELARAKGIVASRLKAGRTFEQALRTGLAAVICSPDFLYLREEPRPDGRVSDLELASRLAVFLWSSIPDEELLRLAGQGRLRDPGVLRAQVRRMLGHPRRERLVERFTAHWLNLRNIEATSPDRKLYKDFDDLLQWSMVEEGRAFFRELLTGDLPLERLLDSDFAMLNRRLARHYGLPEVEGIALRRIPLPPDSVRGGVLTQAGVLKVTANGTTSSPVVRGVWVLENILGRAIPPPPPNIQGIEPDIRGATTIREQLEKHRTVESCSACHRHIDPPGFALESFDPVGAFRKNYLRWMAHPQNPEWGHVADGAAVDAGGRLPTGEAFTGIREFKKLLVARKDDFARCLAGKLLSYGLGREIGFSDREAVAAAASRAAASGNGLRTLVEELVLSPLFQSR